MRIKGGVSLRGVKTEALVGMMIVDDVLRQNASELVLTSVTEGKHSYGSLHYVGFAFDVRAREFEKEYAANLLQQFRYALEEEYDVILELTDDGLPSHFHIEYQPKLPL